MPRHARFTQPAHAEIQQRQYALPAMPHGIRSFSGAPGTPSFHNQATQFQACTLCHVQIHGSNFDAILFQIGMTMTTSGLRQFDPFAS